MTIFALALAFQLASAAPSTVPARTAASNAAPSVGGYTLTILPPPGVGQSDGFGANAQSGLVLGGTRPVPGSFTPAVWRAGVLYNLPKPQGATSAWAFTPNASGTVVCNAQSANGEIAYVNIAGQNQLLAPILGVRTVATALNDAGVVVGASSDGFASHPHAAVAWAPTGAVLPLGSPPAATAVARAVNRGNEVVGEFQPTLGDNPVPFTWLHGVFTPLATLPGSSHGAALDINDHGVIVGVLEDQPTDRFAAVWIGHAPFALSVPAGVITSFARQINERGQILGVDTTSAGSFRSFLWFQGTFTYVEDLVPPMAGWKFNEAYGLDDSGRIVGDGFLNGQLRAFVLSPN